MKIISKIKKIFTLVGAFFIGIKSTVLGVDPSMLNISSVSTQTDYGVMKPKGVTGMSDVILRILDLLSMLIIPVVFLIGWIIYIKKSKSSTMKKYVVLLILIAIAVVIRLAYYCIVASVAV